MSTTVYCLQLFSNIMKIKKMLNNYDDRYKLKPKENNNLVNIQANLYKTFLSGKNTVIKNLKIELGVKYKREKDKYRTRCLEGEEVHACASSS